MAKKRKVNQPTPNGGDYSEIYYFNDSGESVDESVATRCVIRECKTDGSLVNEIWATVNKDETYKE